MRFVSIAMEEDGTELRRRIYDVAGPRLVLLLEVRREGRKRIVSAPMRHAMRPRPKPPSGSWPEPAA
jgi:hypothetical protein